MKSKKFRIFFSLTMLATHFICLGSTVGLDYNCNIVFKSGIYTGKFTGSISNSNSPSTYYIFQSYNQPDQACVQIVPSTNPVRAKIIKEALDNRIPSIISVDNNFTITGIGYASPNSKAK